MCHVHNGVSASFYLEYGHKRSYVIAAEVGYRPLKVSKNPEKLRSVALILMKNDHCQLV